MTRDTDTPLPARTPTEIRLLEAAGEVFAELGFREATVRDICKRAGVNIAAVNYHFGDKERLYHEVLAYSGQMAMRDHGMPGRVGPAALGPPGSAPTAEAKLLAYIKGFLERILDEGRPAWYGQLMAREMVEPTSALDLMVERYIRPQSDWLRELIGHMLGDAATPERIRMCTCSVVGQCLFYKHCRPVVTRLMPEQGFTPADRAALAAHITRFCLGGIEAIRASSSSGAAPVPRAPSRSAGPRTRPGSVRRSK